MRYTLWEYLIAGVLALALAWLIVQCGTAADNQVDPSWEESGLVRTVN